MISSAAIRHGEQRTASLFTRPVSYTHLRIKLYFMMGLPGETDEDIVAIAELADHTLEIAREVVPKEQRGGISVSISVSVFIPKAHTPFQWCPQLDDAEVKRRQQLLFHSVKNRAVRIHCHDAATSLVEAVMSRGGRDIAPQMCIRDRSPPAPCFTSPSPRRSPCLGDGSISCSRSRSHWRFREIPVRLCT